jgi:hypothetical protein
MKDTLYKHHRRVMNFHLEEILKTTDKAFNKEPKRPPLPGTTSEGQTRGFHPEN